MNKQSYPASSWRAVAALLATATLAAGAVNTWDGTTWSDGTPTSDDDIVIAGDLTWDASLPSTVASWTQNSGTARVMTTFPAYSATFTLLTVTGHMAINGGTLTHETNRYDASPASHGTPMPQRYRLAVDVGGT